MYFLASSRCQATVRLNLVLAFKIIGFTQIMAEITLYINLLHNVPILSVEKLKKEDCKIPNDWHFPFCKSKVQVSQATVS